jgi:hypothetical protein
MEKFKITFANWKVYEVEIDSIRELELLAEYEQTYIKDIKKL